MWIDWLTGLSVLWGGWALIRVLNEITTRASMWRDSARWWFYLGLPAWAWWMALWISGRIG